MPSSSLHIFISIALAHSDSNYVSHSPAEMGAQKLSMSPPTSPSLASTAEKELQATNDHPEAVLRRSLETRSVTEDAGKHIQDWIASRSPNAIFALTTASCFIAFLILLGTAWESLRRCRSSLHAGQPDHWHRLHDGSTVRTRDGAYAGPMATLLRESAAGGTPDVAALAGAPRREQRMDAHAMSGVYAAYDPPPVHRPAGPYPAHMSGLAAGQTAPHGHAPSPKPSSVETAESRWSESTKVGDSDVGKKEEEDKVARFAPVGGQRITHNPLFLPNQPPLPPAPLPATSSTPLTYVGPAVAPINPSGRVSTTMPAVTPARGLPLPGSAPSSVLHPLSSAAVVGESAFSTPKSTPAEPVTVAAGRTTHQRGASSGAFTPMPLALSSAATTRSLSSTAAATSGAEPPKVELKRTWSIGTWIPQLKEGARQDGDNEEEKVRLVGRG
ncbi:hypothetical protein JCM3770_000178 [Rhodotorula araucariae]